MGGRDPGAVSPAVTMIETDKFLTSLGWLKGEPTAKPEGPLPGGK